jgi:hypothetical protein
MMTLFFFPRKVKQKDLEILSKQDTPVQDPFQKLGSQYCISFGNESAPIKIVEFFSFQCPHCIRLFKEDFKKIKQDFIRTGKISFKFHPVPADFNSAQAMICLEKLTEFEKCIFLEEIFEEVDTPDSDLMAKLMMTAMKVFNKPIPSLEDEEFVQNHPVLKEIHQFLIQEKIYAVPTLEINGHLFAHEIPTYQFIKSLIKD